MVSTTTSYWNIVCKLISCVWRFYWEHTSYFAYCAWHFKSIQHLTNQLWTGFGEISMGNDICGTRSSNKVKWFDLKLGYQKSSSSNVYQGDMLNSHQYFHITGSMLHAEDILTYFRIPVLCMNMMTTWNGNALWGKPPVPCGSPSQRTSLAGLWCFFYVSSNNCRTCTRVAGDAETPWRSCIVAVINVEPPLHTRSTSDYNNATVKKPITYITYRLCHNLTPQCLVSSKNN